MENIPFHQNQGIDAPEIKDSDSFPITLKTEDSELKVEVLINQDHSLWITNLSHENVKPQILTTRSQGNYSLSRHDVLKIQKGDCIGFSGKFLRFNVEGTKLLIRPVDSLSQEEN